MSARSNLFRCAAGVLGALLWAGTAWSGDDFLRKERYPEAFSAAIELLGQRLETRGALDPRTVDALEQAGWVAHLGGDERTADEVLEAALEARRRLPRNDAALGRTLVRRGRVARYRDKLAVAQPCFDEAEKILAAMAAPPGSLRADLFEEQGDMARRKNFDAAIAPYRRALAVRRASSSGPSLDTADTLTWLAWMLLRTGQTREAVVLTHEARGMLQALGLERHTLGATLAGLLAGAQEVAGRTDQATPFRREEAAILAAARRKQLGGFPRVRFPLDGYESLALAAVENGHGDDAWMLLERGRGAGHVDFTTLGLWEQRDPRTWAIARGLRAELASATRRRVAASPDNIAWSPANAPVFVRVLELRAALHDLERRYLLAHRPEAPSRAAVDAALGPRRALVGWLQVQVGETDAKAVPLRSVGYAYVLRPGRPVVWVPLWDARSPAEFRRLTQDFPNAWESIRRAASWRRRVDRDPEVDEQLQAWGLQRFEPLLPHLRGVEHLVLESPMDFGELLRLRDGRMVGDVFDVSFVPSALVLQLLAERATPAPARLARVLAVSGPTDPGPASVASLVDMTEGERSHRQFRSAFRRDKTPLDQLPRLRFAGLEARAVGQKFSQPIVLVEQGSVEQTLDTMATGGNLRQFDVVHLAGHTLTDPVPERCALALSERTGNNEGSDGLLEVEDMLLGWELDAELLALSGCETMRAAGEGRGEPLGFLPALFGSGAHRILSSIWTVDDRATALLMDRFYENLTGRFRGERLGYREAAMPPARALREAKIYMRTLRDKNGRRPFEHPAYWGGFVLMGLP